MSLAFKLHRNPLLVDKAISRAMVFRAILKRIGSVESIDSLASGHSAHSSASAVTLLGHWVVKLLGCYGLGLSSCQAIRLLSY